MCKMCYMGLIEIADRSLELSLIILIETEANVMFLILKNRWHFSAFLSLSFYDSMGSYYCLLRTFL